MLKHEAELAVVKVLNNRWLAKWERAERQLAEVRKALEATLAAKDAELAETASALWRIQPNTHTIPCEINGFVEPDPFEGVGETYADAYTREKSRAERAEAQLAEARKALADIERYHRNSEYVLGTARRALEAQGGK